MSATKEQLEAIGRVMHEQWSKRKREQGFHGPNDKCDRVIDEHGTFVCGDPVEYLEAGVTKEAIVHCAKFHSDLVPWEQLPEAQKEIHRHALDAALATGVVVLPQPSRSSEQVSQDVPITASKCGASTAMPEHHRMEGHDATVTYPPQTAPAPLPAEVEQLVSEMYYAQKDGCKKHNPYVGKICYECVVDALGKAKQRESAAVAAFKKLVIDEIERRLLPKPRPTIAELEQILETNGQEVIEIDADGSVHVGGGLKGFIESIPADSSALDAAIEQATRPLRELVQTLVDALAKAQAASRYQHKEGFVCGETACGCESSLIVAPVISQNGLIAQVLAAAEAQGFEPKEKA